MTELEPKTESAPPVPLDVLVAWLRKKSAQGVPIRIAAHLAQRIAAELDLRLGDSPADGRSQAVAGAPGEPKAHMHG